MEAVSFAEIGIGLILYAKNCMSKRADRAECVIPAWHVTQKEFWKEFFFFTDTDFASDSLMSSPLPGLPWYVARLVS